MEEPSVRQWTEFIGWNIQPVRTRFLLLQLYGVDTTYSLYGIECSVRHYLIYSRYSTSERAVSCSVSGDKLFFFYRYSVCYNFDLFTEAVDCGMPAAC